MVDDRLPLLTFPDAASLDRWLDEHGATSPGAWLRFTKKGAVGHHVAQHALVEVSAIGNLAASDETVAPADRDTALIPNG